MRRLTERLGCDDGIGVTELLVAVSLLLVVGGVVTTSLLSAYRTQLFAQQRIDALTSLHTAAQHLSRDIRVADSRDVSGGALRSAGAQQMVFDVYRDDTRIELTLALADADGDGRWTLTESRRVWSDARVLMSTNPAPSQTSSRPLAHRIADPASAPATPLFTYFDATGAELPAPLSAVDLRLVTEVRMVLRGVTQVGQDPIHVETRIGLRNAG